jgi:hypothetical protein
MPSTVSWAAKVRAAAERTDASREPSLGINQLHLNEERNPSVGHAHQQQQQQQQQQQRHYTQQHEQPYQGYVGMRLHAQLAAPAPKALETAPLSSSLHSSGVATTPPQQQQQQHYINGAVGGLALPPHHLGLLGLSLGSAMSSSTLISSSSSATGSSATKTTPATAAAAIAVAVAEFSEPAQFGQHLPLELPAVANSCSEAKEDLLGTFPCVKLRGLALETSVKDVLDFFVGLGPVLDIVLQPMDPRRTVGGARAAEAVVLFGNILDYRGALQVSHYCSI